MLITLQELQSLHPGHVLKRWTTHSGRHEKIRVVRPRRHLVCDACGEWIEDTAIRTETSGNITISTECLYCGMLELNKISAK